MPSARLSLVPPVGTEEMVDPYAYSLAIAYLLSPDFTEAERHLEGILTAYCELQGIDQEALLENCSAYLREAGVR
jgi:hypothetical protein